MALQKNVVPISFAQGVDTKTDVKQVVQGKLVVLENGIFQTSKEIRKRNGYTALGQNIDSGGSISNGVSISTFKNELNLADGNKFYTYSNKENKWTQKGNLLNVGLSSNPVIRNNYEQTMQDSAYNAGIQVFAWNDSSGGVRYSVIDYNTKESLVSNALLLSTAVNPKVLNLGTNIVIIYYDTASTFLKYQYISTTTPTTISAAATLATDLGPTVLDSTHTSYTYDAAAFNSRIYIAYNNQTTGVSVLYLTHLFVVSSATAVNGVAGSLGISILNDASNNAWVAFTNGVLVKYFILDPTLLITVLASTQIDSVSGHAKNITGTITGSTATYYYEMNQDASTYLFPSNSDKILVKRNTATLTGTVGSPTVLIRSVGLASKAFIYSGVAYFLAAFDSNLQARYFLLNDTGEAVLKLSAEPYLGGGLIIGTVLPQVNLISSGLYEISYLQRKNIGETSTINSSEMPIPTSITVKGVMDGIVNFLVSDQSQFNDVANGNHLPGGVLSLYDGNNVAEHGFNLYPENVIGDYLASTNGTLAEGQYQYSAVYQWIDNFGQIHRSAPSIPVTTKVGQSRSLSFGGSAGSGDTTIGSTLVDGLFSDESGRSLVKGAGLPTNTYVASITNVTTFTTSQATTASLSGTHITATPTINASLYGNTQDKKTFLDQDFKYIHVYGSITSGSPVWIVKDPSQLMPGYTVEGFVSGDIPANTTISSIVGNTVTLNQNAGRTVSEIVLKVSFQFTATTSNLSTTITGVPAVAFTILNVNDNLSSANFSVPQDRIVSLNPGAGEIVVDVIPNVPGSVTIFGLFGADKVLKKGMVISDSTAYPVGTQILGIERGLFTYEILPGQTFVTVNNRITVDQLASVAASNTTNIIFNTLEGYVTVPTLRITKKVAPNTPVSVFLYRTELNGTIFYRVSSLTNLTINDVTVDSVSFIDGQPDSVIISNDQLYTTGGEVENISAPATALVCTYKNRLVLIPSENNNSFWYSKEVIPGTPVEFSDIFIQNIDQRGGGITAIHQLDDKLILFKKNQIFYIVGDGPTPSGGSNDFTNAQLITTDNGCTNPNSIVTMPSGLMYQSAKGIYLLDRSLQVQYIGADVEFYNNQTVTSAVLIQNVNQVRFTLGSGVCLVYDYYFNQWSVFTNVSSVSSVNFVSNYNFLQSNGLVLQETPGVFTDNGSFIKLKLTSSWLSFAGLQGFQRVYKMLILGEYKSAHSLVVNVAYNFDPTFTQTDTISTSSVLPYQYRIFFARQKCEAIQIELEDSQVMPFGEGVSLSSFGLEVGVKTGLNKITAANSYG